MVLLAVVGAPERAARRVQAGVVAGGQRRGADRAGEAQERAELQPLVAADAGVGGARGPVLGHEVVDDGAAEGLGLVEHVVGEPERGRRGAGVLDVARAAAAPPRLAAVPRGVDTAQGHAHHLEAARTQQRRGRRGVDAAGHGTTAMRGARGTGADVRAVHCPRRESGRPHPRDQAAVTSAAY